jgi:chorismate dehydratase
MGNAFKKAIEHKKGVPSLINKKFQKRQVSAAFISSIYSNSKNIKTLPVGIIAKKQVKSVILKRGACKDDPASATSNMLCRVLGVDGEIFIGDRALKLYLENPLEYVDLAQLWHEKYNLPFVFAVLCTNKYHSIYKKLVNNFKKKKIKIPQYILKDYAKKRHIEVKEIKEYLKLISYNINTKEKKALKLFLNKSKALGLKK